MIKSCEPESKFDLFDLDDRQFLTMADGLVITLAAFHLEREFFLAALVRDHVGDDARARNGRRAHRDFVAADHEHAVKRERFAGLGLEPFDFQRVARRDAILFAACF